MKARPRTGNEFSSARRGNGQAQGAGAVVISARIEEEVAQLPADERAEFLASLGLEEPGLNRLIRAGYDLLGLITFFTAGPKEARAWTVTRGSRAPQAAGVIHTDFEQGFIRAETIAYDDYVALGGEAGARDAGKFRLEGKDYVVARRRRDAFPVQRMSGCFNTLTVMARQVRATQLMTITAFENYLKEIFLSVSHFMPTWVACTWRAMTS